MSIGAAALNEFVLIFQGIMTLIVRDPSSALIHSVRPDRVPGARGDGSQVPDGGTHFRGRGEEPGRAHRATNATRAPQPSAEAFNYSHRRLDPMDMPKAMSCKR